MPARGGKTATIRDGLTNSHGTLLIHEFFQILKEYFVNCCYSESGFVPLASPYQRWVFGIGKDVMRLFANALSGNSYKIRLLLAETGRSCEIVPVDIFKGESRTPEFIDCNPAGQTPVLELDDGRYLAESNAILCFLANGTALFPNDGRAQAQVLR